MLCKKLRGENSTAQLIVFGSTTTRLDWTNSPMDIFVDLGLEEENTENTFEELIKIFTDSTNIGTNIGSLKRTGRRIHLDIRGVTLRFHRDRAVPLRERRGYLQHCFLINGLSRCCKLFSSGVETFAWLTTWRSVYFPQKICH